MRKTCCTRPPFFEDHGETSPKNQQGYWEMPLPFFPCQTTEIKHLAELIGSYKPLRGNPAMEKTCHSSRGRTSSDNILPYSPDWYFLTAGQQCLENSQSAKKITRQCPSYWASFLLTSEWYWPWPDLIKSLLGIVLFFHPITAADIEQMFHPTNACASCTSKTTIKQRQSWSNTSIVASHNVPSVATATISIRRTANDLEKRIRKTTADFTEIST